MSQQQNKKGGLQKAEASAQGASKAKRGAVIKCQVPISKSPANVAKTLFQPYGKPINGVMPLVPATWTFDPITQKLGPIKSRYPDAEQSRARVTNLIGQIKTASPDANTKPLEDLISTHDPAGYHCELVRDYNGEYAPCIAAVKAGMRCIVLPAQKPSSVLDVAKKVGVIVDLSKCKETENPAICSFITKEVSAKGKLVAFNAEEKKRCEDLATSLFEPLLSAKGLHFDVQSFVLAPGKTLATTGRSMNSLHESWVIGGALPKFRDNVKEFRKQEFASDKDTRQWVANVLKQFPPVLNGNTDIKAGKDNVVSFSVWIRAQEPRDHTHNMSEDLLFEIADGLGHIMKHQHAEKKEMIFVFLLFGDGAKTVADLWNHQKKAAPTDKRPVPTFIAETFTKAYGDGNIVVRIHDLRELYKQSDKVRGAKPKAKDDGKQGDPEAEDSGKPKNLGYSEQYAFMQGVNDTLGTSFMIGCESGNMDGFGYCGTPVVSIDVDDSQAQTDTVQQDRIGKYSLVSPLFSTLNYHHGADPAQFRQFLYGNILMHTEFGAPPGEGKKGDEDAQGTEDLLMQEAILASLAELDEKAAQQHREALQDRFDIVDVKGDGNCLFRALSKVCLGHENQHAVYRADAVAYAGAHYGLAQIVAGSGAQFATIDEYKNKMGQPALSGSDQLQWGGDVELSAFAQANGLKIEIYSANSPDPIVIDGGNNRTVCLSYVNRAHYMALLPKG